MSGQSPSSSQQTGKVGRARKHRTLQAGSQRGGNNQVYLHHVTDMEAALLTENKCQEIKRNTGAYVEIAPDPSDVQNTKTVIIRGSLSQIEAAIKIINQETGIQTKTISAQAQTFWQQWVEATFPNLESGAYFLPPVYFNRVPINILLTAGQDVFILHEAPGQAGQSTPGQAGQSTPGQAGQSTPGQAGHSKQPPMNPSACNQGSQPSNVLDSDVRDDAAMQRFFCCLKKMTEENEEVFVGLSQLQFGQYLGEPCYAAAATHLPVADSLPAALSKYKRGDFDMLLIHRQYGILVCEVKAFGDNVGELNMSQQHIDKNIRSKLSQAVSQLDKADAMLSHLVSDVTPGVRITKTIVVPSLTARQVQQAISGDTKLTQDLCRCLGTTDHADITGLCLCSDQLSDPKTPWDVSSDVLREFENWWQRRVAVSGPDSRMTLNNYKTLVARFCGPATTVTVPYIFPPRLCVKTLGQAVSLTGEFYAAQIALFPEQLDILSSVHPRLFVAGPPGTGKTVVLLLKAAEWLRCGDDVYIVSMSWSGRAACIMLYHLLQDIVKTQQTSVVTPGQLHILQYEFTENEDLGKAVAELSLAAMKGPLYVIVDEVDDVRIAERDFSTFCEKLLTNVPDLHLWAASCFHRTAPGDWQLEYLTRPLRFPPTVVREVQQDQAITDRLEVQAYSQRSVPDHTDGPPVKQLYHRGQGHTCLWPRDCVTCGRDIASFLHGLRVPVNSTAHTTITTTNSSATPPCLEWKDVFVLWHGDVSEQSGVVTGLREADIPVRVMKAEDAEDVATARSDVVWVASGDRVRGLERKVVVWLDHEDNYNDHDLSTVRLHYMSRCTSQLVIVYPEYTLVEYYSHFCHQS